MTNTIKIKRGLKANLSVADTVVGELKFTTDTQDLYIGTGDENICVGGKTLNDKIETIKADLGDLGDQVQGLEARKQNTLTAGDNINITGSTIKAVVPTKTSQLENNSGFILNTVENLVNYYNKNETYDKEEISELLRNIGAGLGFAIVEVLPTEEISTSTIYLIKISETIKTTDYIWLNDAWTLAEGHDTTGYAISEVDILPSSEQQTNTIYRLSLTNTIYSQWMYISNAWANIGSTETNLENYYTKEEINNKLQEYITSSNLTTILTNTLNNYYNKEEIEEKLEEEYYDAQSIDAMFDTKQSIIQYSTMPIATAENLGKIYQYTGDTNISYIQGGFYKCVSDGEVIPTYRWENIKIDNNIIDDDFSETSGNAVENKVITKRFLNKMPFYETEGRGWTSVQCSSSDGTLKKRYQFETTGNFRRYDWDNENSTWKQEGSYQLTTDTYNDSSELSMSGKAVAEAISYKVGDIINISPVPLSGFITSGSQKILCLLPLPKSLIGRTVSISNWKFDIRYGSSYALPTNDSNSHNYSSDKLTLQNYGSVLTISSTINVVGITIWLSASTKWYNNPNVLVDNNNPVSVMFSGTITITG